MNSCIQPTRLVVIAVIVGLAVTALLAATLAWTAGTVRGWRRFGWFVADNLPPEPTTSRPPWFLFLAIAVPAALLHFAFDVITGFGNMKPFWPWSDWDASLHAVSSFDFTIFASTLGVYLALRYYDATRRQTLGYGSVYLLAVALYVVARHVWGPSSII